MWQGIIVQAGANITVKGNTLIEDAINAVDCSSWNQTGNTLTINGAVFNKNLTSVSIKNYSFSGSNFPSSIKDAVFTSRNLPAPVFGNSILLPTTSSLKTNSGASSLSSPYTTLNSHAVATLKNPNLGQPPMQGIYVNSVGFTNQNTSTTPPTPISYNSLNIGAAGTANKALFDQISTGVYSEKGSNVIIVNSDFANTPYYANYDNGYNNSGTGVFSINQLNGVNVPVSTNNNLLQVAYPAYVYGTAPTSTPPADNCNFYNCITGVELFVNSETHVVGTTIQSTQDVSTQNGSLAGALGIDEISTYYFLNDLSNNTITNTSTGIKYEAGDYAFCQIEVIRKGHPQGTCFATEYLGITHIDNNTIQNDLSGGSTNTSRFVQYGIVAENVITCQNPPPPHNNINNVYNCNQLPNSVTTANNNFIYHAYNGIAMGNWQFSNSQSCQTQNNFITLVKDLTLNASNPGDQYGVNHYNNINNTVYDNNVSGINLTTPPSYITVHGVWAQTNATQLIQCNSASYVQRGFDFLGMNAPTTPTQWMDNQMQNNSFGLFMNAATIGAQMGTSGNPVMDNHWIGIWNNTTLLQTFNNNNSNLNNSKLFCRTGTQYLPTHTGSLPLPGFGYNSGNYSGTIISATHGTTRTCPALPVPCSNNCRLAAANRAILEKIATNNLVFNTLVSQSQFMSKLQLLRAINRDSTLLDSSAILQNFYANSTSSPHAMINNIESQLAQGNATAAQSMLASFTTTDTVAISHKTLLSAITNMQTNGYTNSDSSALHNLATSCPLIYGTAVYQARALYNALYRKILPFKDNCENLNVSSSARLANVTDVNQLPINSNQLMVYPNPSSGELFISGSDLTDKEWSVEITDVTGRIVLQDKYTVTNGLVKLNTQLIDGVYFVRVITSSGFVKQQKVIITN